MTAVAVQQRAGCDLRMPNKSHFAAFVRSNAKRARGRMLRPDTRLGKRVAICGAGPSLRATLDDVRAGGYDEVWACNSALPYLVREGVRPTHAVTIDQGEEMLREAEFGIIVPGLTYLLATGVNPKLTAHLRRANARVRWFHSFLGIDAPPGWDGDNASYEMHLYRTLYDLGTVVVGHGLNTVPRAVCLAMAMGFAAIDVYGADCACAPDAAPMPPDSDGMDVYRAWLDTLVFYADGRTGRTFGDTPFAEAEFGGHRWHTRPDMVVSATHLLDLVAESQGRVRLLGETLPNAIAAEGPEFLAQMPRLDNEIGRVVNFGVAP